MDKLITSMQPNQAQNDTIIDTDALFIFLTAACAECNEDISNLLRPGVKYSISRNFTRKMAELTSNLLEKCVQRASLFGQYRTNALNESDTSNKRKKVVMRVEEYDFNLAWQTIMQDNQN